jgi:hypothetical protein
MCSPFSFNLQKRDGNIGNVRVRACSDGDMIEITLHHDRDKYNLRRFKSS